MLISVIVPSRKFDEATEALLAEIPLQKVSFPVEVVRIDGVSPSGKARNAGAQKAGGDVLVFLDNDISFGHGAVLQNIVDALLGDETIGVCGASQLIPADANAFQQRCGRELLHVEHPVVEELTEMGMVGAACCAVRKEVFVEAGRFNEELPRGVDVEFCHRIKDRGLRVVLAPRTWVYHPPARNLAELIGLSFRDGTATAYVDKFFPGLNFDVGTTPLITALQEKSAGYRALRFAKGVLRAVGELKFLRLTSKLVYASGYLWGRVFRRRK